MRFNRWIGTALTTSWLVSASVAGAQVAVQVSPDGDVQVQTNTSSVTVGGDSRSTSTATQRSYQYQDNSGTDLSTIDIDRGDLSASNYYLVLQAPSGRSLRGQIFLNGRLLANLSTSRLILPLDSQLRPGTNRIEVTGTTTNALVGLAAGPSRPYFYGRQLRGAQQSWLQQTSSALQRSIVVTLR
ncbi:hypothetical protein [Gloeobacter kilaueensis]|uniref:Uncharacterized protein n=1 Tax=Gloeobacter kilaueensis (strain ATCC BAA-2537 / CCAP 1431/1 / ULC 316 / JS1) TaxID=1183438 RepID=U5QFR2_GLOK1|nr:hypothetical protein [Gloeobacter kilaueensis]AGY57718.1 hypothetical protein GKIL_1472 [Gloeobacter kilaueensis JS1]